MADFSVLTAFLDSLPAVFKIPGCDLSVRVNHEEVYRHWAGEKKPGVPMQGDEWYVYYSCSKISTMIASMQLIEQGKIALDDPIYKYLPAYEHMTYKDADGNIKPVSRPITVQDCMTMSAGMTYDWYTPAALAAVEKYGEEITTRQVIDALAEGPLNYDPGTSFMYSYAHDVMGAIVEVVSGMTFGEYLTENIYKPLGITDITFHPTVPEDRFMARYRATVDAPCGDIVPSEIGIVKNDMAFYGKMESGGAALRGTVEAYSLVMDMLANWGVGANGARILKKESVEQFMVNRLSDQQLENSFRHWGLNIPDYGWGLCGRVKMSEGPSKSPIGEFGWCGAAGCYALADNINHVSIFYGQHILGYGSVVEDLVQPVIKNLVYECLGEEPGK